MRVRRDLPNAVREIEHLWITLADGTRLSARLWLPAGAEQAPVPAIVEYLPYRKRDDTRERDEPMHRWFAGHGFAALRVDLRGCGESDGLLLDEYLPQELDDGVEVLGWTAAQPWCTGAVGMLGKSWGGFNALQIAARAPPELGAVVSVCATDDRYADDAHYMGGCLLCENLTWGSMLFTQSARAPDPALVGQAWRARWLERLEANPLFPAIWLARPTRDAYWKHGSVCEDFAAIRCPVFAVGGWADGYSNAIPRLMAGLRVPRRGLIGPWAHRYPHNGVPGPAIGFLQEVERWFGRWLRPEDPAALRGPAPEAEPLYRVWMQESARPQAALGIRAGRWVAEPSWPSARIESRPFALTSAGSLVPGTARADQGTLSIRSPETVGAAGGAWCAFGFDGELPGDQREDDAGSLCFDSEPLPERVEILGAPVLELELSSDRAAAFVVARLCELFPDGASARVSYGVLNLAHREGHERPRPLEPGRSYRVRVALNDVAHAFAAGQRLRLALSTAYWPIVWPAPERARLTVRPGRSRFCLPVRPPRAEDLHLRPFPPPEGAPADPTTDVHPGGVQRRVRVDPVSGEHVLEVAFDRNEQGEPALTRFDAIDLVAGSSIIETFRIHPEDPLSARLAISQDARSSRGEWSTSVRTRLELQATGDAFRLRARLEAHEGEAQVFVRDWDECIPRGVPLT